MPFVSIIKLKSLAQFPVDYLRVPELMHSNNPQYWCVRFLLFLPLSLSSLMCIMINFLVLWPIFISSSLVPNISQDCLSIYFCDQIFLIRFLLQSLVSRSFLVLLICSSVFFFFFFFFFNLHLFDDIHFKHFQVFILFFFFKSFGAFLIRQFNFIGCFSYCFISL